MLSADERLTDIVGSAYYVAPEVLHRSYGTEADVWSIGVITYILLCGSRPFWARTESGIFRAVIRTDPSFDEMPWPDLSLEAKDFVKRLLSKDHRKRMTAAQALSKFLVYLVVFYGNNSKYLTLCINLEFCSSSMAKGRP
jgi:serine/threonine protein kinase